MKKLTALIVDDEELARIGLKQLLDKLPNIELVGEAYNVQSAAEAIDKFKPDVVFLDIEFPGESGFDLLEHIIIPTKIVFVTAYDEFAIRAFEVNACDYLLKPVSLKRLENTFQRISVNEDSTKIPEQRYKYEDQIFVVVNYKYHFIRLNNIIRISSEGKYSEIFTTAKIKGLVKKSMHDWEECLPENYFLRIHRSTIINTEMIEKVVKDETGFIIYLKGLNTPFPISRRYAAKIKNIKLT